MQLGQSLRTILAHKCSVCLRIRNEDRAAEDSAIVAISGALPYAQCPCCRQIVDDNTRVYDWRYRARARSWEQKNSGVKAPRHKMSGIDG